MSYTICFSDFALKQIKKLNKLLQQRIIDTLQRCRIRPYPHVKKLVGSRYYRLRVGDYRIILDIVDGQVLIHVIEIGHRRNVYKT